MIKEIKSYVVKFEKYYAKPCGNSKSYENIRIYHAIMQSYFAQVL